MMTETVNRVEKLTAKQIECLALVPLYLSSKDIARVVGISNHTVDRRLKDAMHILNVGSRGEAARIYLRYIEAHPEAASRTGGYQGLVYQNEALARAPRSDELDAPHRSVDRRGAEVTDYTHDAEGLSFGQGEQAGLRWSVLAGVDRDNNLSAFVRVLVILTCAMAAIASFALLVNVAEGLSRLR